MNSQKMMVLGGLLLLSAFWARFATLPQARAQAPTSGAMLFEGARLIAGDGSAPIENSAFVVETGRFTGIGKRGEILAPRGAIRIDLNGKTVIPGLIDTHGHLGITREDYINQLNLLAFCGIAVTTSMGRDSEAVFPVRAEYLPNGAQILTSGRGLVGPLGVKPETIAAGSKGRLPEDQVEIALSVMSELTARLHVRELAAQRVDFVKIWVDDRLGTELAMAPAVYRALIDEAHKHNLRVLVHSWYLQDAKDMLRAGVDCFAHPIRDKDVDDELIQLLKDRPNVYMQTNVHSTEFLTLTEDPAWFKDPLLLDIATPPEIQSLHAQIEDKTTRVHEGWPSNMSKADFARLTYGYITRNTAKLYKAGIPYALGTDSGGPPQGFDYHVEMELLVKDVGLTPSQVITMSTLSAARALELDRHLGSIESGKDATFVVLNDNPLDDITNTRRISKVYLRGHEVDRAGFLTEWKKYRAQLANSRARTQ
jgi:imidazolonepropionase-like amidohydrolase